MLSGFWLHRNLLGGAEKLRIDAMVGGIGSQTGGIKNGVDFSVGARLDRPATFGADKSLYILGRVERKDEPNYLSDQINLATGVQWFVSDQLTLEAGIGLRFAHEIDNAGSTHFNHIMVPLRATWDKRDVALDPKGGFFLNAEVTPYIGMRGSATGARLFVDGRAYHSLDTEGRFVLAERLQLGGVFGSSINDTPQEFLFYSGGGGTVRGQPYQSLGIDPGTGKLTGGRSFIGASVELRTELKGKFGAVGFFDTGYIGANSTYGGTGGWHSGAGLGLRYETGIGLLRFDVATPIGGSTSGKGLQFYIGIGQAF
jgi:translocation and assembly module TamA